MPSGKRLPPTRFPLPLRLAAALPLGTLFVGSGLVGLPTAAASSDPAAPAITFSPASTVVEAGETASTEVMVSPGAGEVCLFDLTVDGGFELSGELTSRRAPATVEISGVPEGTTEVNATVTYAEVENDAECPAQPPEGAAQSGSRHPFVATVQEPTEEPTDEPTDGPSPSPTDEPTDGPSPSPTDEPTDGPSPSPTTSPTPSPTGSPDPGPTGSSSPPDSPSPTSTGGGDGGGHEGGDGGNGGGNSGGGSGGPGSGSGSDGSSNSGGGSGGSGSDGGSGDGYAAAPPHSGVPTDGLGAGAGAGGSDLPELPSGAPDLPGLDSPSGDDPLAELPSVEPGEGDDTSRTTEMAASEKEPTSIVTPAVLVLFLLLLLLFATPLAPSRRVRIGPSAYKGRRRKH